MDPATLMAIGALVGIGKSEFIDKPQEQKERNIAATKARYSPWTGIDAKNPAPTDYFGNTMGGALTGGALAQSPWFNQAPPADAGTMDGAVPLGDHPPSNTAPAYGTNTPNHWNSGWAKGPYTTPAVRSY